MTNPFDEKRDTSGGTLATQKAPNRGLLITIVVLLAVLVLSLGSCAILGSLGTASMMKLATSVGSPDTPDDSIAALANTKGDAIAVYHMNAAISANAGVTPEKIRDLIKKVNRNPRIKALVIRVNSPGGTVAASEEIARYIESAEKPVVFSVSDICASGAYMAASQSDAIVALPTSQVGSIGVIMQTLDISELLDKLGIKMDSIKSTAQKDAGALYRSLTPEEQQRLQAEVDELHQMFIEIVAKGRDLPADKVAELANGTTYSGKRALEYGLIDELGTFDDALTKASKLAGHEGGQLPAVDLDPTPGVFESIFGISGFSSSELKQALKEVLIEAGA